MARALNSRAVARYWPGSCPDGLADTDAVPGTHDRRFVGVSDDEARGHSDPVAYGFARSRPIEPPALVYLTTERSRHLRYMFAITFVVAAVLANSCRAVCAPGRLPVLQVWNGVLACRATNSSAVLHFPGHTPEDCVDPRGLSERISLTCRHRLASASAMELEMMWKTSC